MNGYPLKNRRVLITGATDGIGRETARMMYEHGAKMILHGRNPEKAERVRNEILQIESEERAEDAPGLMIADFSDLDNVVRLASALRESYPDLSVLINNAGLYVGERKLSAQGFEMTFAVNYLAAVLLSLKTADLLEKNAPAKVINLSSATHFGASLDSDQLERLLLAENGKYNGYDAYASSKLALTLFTVEWAERLSREGRRNLIVNCLHPGGIQTKLLRAGFGGGGLPPAEGGRAVFHVAMLDPEVSGSGNYFNRFEKASPDPRARDSELRQKLWDWTIKVLEPYL